MPPRVPLWRGSSGLRQQELTGAAMSLVEQTWDQILYGLDSVLDLCCSLGLKEDVATSRFLKHRDRLGNLIEALRQRGQEGARELYDTDRLAHIVAIAESGELINLGPFVQNHKKDRALSKKLQAALSGPEFPDEEDKNSNHARNILFELTFAAKLWTAGLEPTLGDPPDLSLRAGAGRRSHCCAARLSAGPNSLHLSVWLEKERGRRAHVAHGEHGGGDDHNPNIEKWQATDTGP